MPCIPVGNFSKVVRIISLRRSLPNQGIEAKLCEEPKSILACILHYESAIHILFTDWTISFLISSCSCSSCNTNPSKKIFISWFFSHLRNIFPFIFWKSTPFMAPHSSFHLSILISKVYVYLRSSGRWLWKDQLLFRCSIHNFSRPFVIQIFRNQWWWPFPYSRTSWQMALVIGTLMIWARGIKAEGLRSSNSLLHPCVSGSVEPTPNAEDPISTLTVLGSSYCVSIGSDIEGLGVECWRSDIQLSKNSKLDTSP